MISLFFVCWRKPVVLDTDLQNLLLPELLALPDDAELVVLKKTK